MFVPKALKRRVRYEAYEDFEENSHIHIDTVLKEDQARKRRRIEQVAHRYLNGRPFRLLSSSLKGPFDYPWQNPWATKACSTEENQIKGPTKSLECDTAEAAPKPLSIEADKTLEVGLSRECLSEMDGVNDRTVLKAETTHLPSSPPPSKASHRSESPFNGARSLEQGPKTPRHSPEADRKPILSPPSPSLLATKSHQHRQTVKKFDTAQPSNIDTPYQSPPLASRQPLFTTTNKSLRVEEAKEISQVKTAKEIPKVTRRQSLRNSKGKRFSRTFEDEQGDDAVRRRQNRNRSSSVMRKLSDRQSSDGPAEVCLKGDTSVGIAKVNSRRIRINLKQAAKRSVSVSSEQSQTKRPQQNTTQQSRQASDCILLAAVPTYDSAMAEEQSLSSKRTVEDDIFAIDCESDGSTKATQKTKKHRTIPKAIEVSMQAKIPSSSSLPSPPGESGEPSPVSSPEPVEPRPFFTFQTPSPERKPEIQEDQKNGACGTTVKSSKVKPRISFVDPQDEPLPLSERNNGNQIQVRIPRPAIKKCASPFHNNNSDDFDLDAVIAEAGSFLENWDVSSALYEFASQTKLCLKQRIDNATETRTAL